MKIKLALSTLTLLSSAAFANDTGYASISVGHLNAKSGTKIEFSGGEANKFFKILPGIQRAGGAEDAKHYKTLFIRTNKTAIILSCADQGMDESGKAVKLKDGVECSITTEDNSEGHTSFESDTFPFNP